MKYKVMLWNELLDDYITWEYPYLETALMMANALCHKTKEKIIVSDGTTKGCYITER